MVVWHIQYVCAHVRWSSVYYVVVMWHSPHVSKLKRHWWCQTWQLVFIWVKWGWGGGVGCLLLTLCACVRLSRSCAVHVCHLSRGCSTVCVGFESWSIICSFSQITSSLGHCCRSRRVLLSGMSSIVYAHAEDFSACLANFLSFFHNVALGWWQKHPKKSGRVGREGRWIKTEKQILSKNWNVLSLQHTYQMSKGFFLTRACWETVGHCLPPAGHLSSLHIDYALITRCYHWTAFPPNNINFEAAETITALHQFALFVLLIRFYRGPSCEIDFSFTFCQQAPPFPPPFLPPSACLLCVRPSLRYTVL